MVIKPAIAAVCLALCAPCAAQAGPLHDAAKAGDIAQIEKLLVEGADINESSLATPLYFAINSQHAEAAQLLIERGADVNARSTLGMPLHAAANKGMTAIASLLLERGADPNALWQQLTALHIAAASGRIEVVRVLLDHGADINARWQQLTALHLAAGYGRIEVVRVLLDHGADVNAVAMYDQSALHLAVKNGHAEIAKLLIERGTKAPPVQKITSLLASADPAKGELVAAPCRGCHSIDREAKIIDGPPLYNIVGRSRASIEEYRYSAALKAAGGTWTYDALNSYIAQPAWTIPGVSMNFPGIPEPQDRANLIAYLRTLSDQPAPLP